MNQIKENENHRDPVYERFLIAVGGPNINIPPNHVLNWRYRIWVDQLSQAANIKPEYMGKLSGPIDCLDQETGFSPEQIFTYKNGQDPQSDHIQANHLYRESLLSQAELAAFSRLVDIYFNQIYVTPYLNRQVPPEKVIARQVSGLIENHLYPRIFPHLTR